MFFIILFMILIVSFLFLLYFLNKIYLLPLIFLLFLFLGIIYYFKYRDINDVFWFAINEETYKYTIDKNFRFKTNNLIEVELNKNITYKLEFELVPYQKNEFHIDKLENMLSYMKDSRVYVLKEKNNLETYGNFVLYQNIESSWSEGTVIYKDNSRNPVVTGFSSESFPVPFSLKKQKIYLKFDINDEELLEYLNKHQINLFITQKSF